MGRTTHRLLLAAIVASVAAAGGLDALTASCAGLAHLLPFALILVPLLAGRYPGEERLARLTGRLLPKPRRRAARALRSGSGRPVTGVPRGGCLIASYLAVRPPPSSARTPI